MEWLLIVLAVLVLLCHRVVVGVLAILLIAVVVGVVGMIYMVTVFPWCVVYWAFGGTIHITRVINNKPIKCGYRWFARVK